MKQENMSRTEAVTLMIFYRSVALVAAAIVWLGLLVCLKALRPRQAGRYLEDIESTPQRSTRVDIELENPSFRLQNDDAQHMPTRSRADSDECTMKEEGWTGVNANQLGEFVLTKRSQHADVEQGLLA